MLELAIKKASYEDLFAVPETMTGEIIDGELIVSPRPSRRHSEAASSLVGEIVPPYKFGRGGPGGWIIQHEPEIAFATDILVPDLAGWRRERFPVEEGHNWISVAPDWVCEVLSPSTFRRDKIQKMRIYGQHQVAYAWLIDPESKILEAYALEGQRWVVLGVYGEGETIRVPPFEEIDIDLSNLWLVV